MQNFGAMEQIVSFLTWAFVGADQTVGQKVTAQMGFRQVRSLVLALCTQYLDSDLQETLRELMRLAAKNEQRRNELTHSAYTEADEEAGTVGRLKFTLREEYVYEDLTTEQIDEVANQIGQTNAALMKFISTLSFRVPALRPRLEEINLS